MIIWVSWICSSSALDDGELKWFFTFLILSALVNYENLKQLPFVFPREI